MLLRICLICSICLAGAIAGVSLTRSGGQHGVRRTTPNTPPKTNPTPRVTPEPTPAPTIEPSIDEQKGDLKDEPQDVESLKTDTNLVTVPVIATTRDGIYIPDLRQEEFSIAEDGEEQQWDGVDDESWFHSGIIALPDRSAEGKMRRLRKPYSDDKKVYRQS